MTTSGSVDQINEYSCSDTSERYFTAAGADTTDELDHMKSDHYEDSRKTKMDHLEDVCLRVSHIGFIFNLLLEEIFIGGME